MQSAENRDSKQFGNRYPGGETTKARGRESVQGQTKDVRTFVGVLSADIQTANAKTFAEFVEAKLAGGALTDQITDRTIKSYLSTYGAVKDAKTFDDEARNIRNWLARLIITGTKPTTVRRYLGKLRTLFTEYTGEAAEAEALFAELREKSQSPDIYARLSTPPALPHLKSIPLRMERLSEHDRLTASMLMFMLYSGGISIRCAAEAKFSDDIPSIPQIHNIVEQQRSNRPKAKYIFPLEQGKHRPERLYLDLSSRLTAFIRSIGYLTDQPVTSDTILGWWVDAALSKLIPLEKIAALIPVIPAAHKWLNLITPASVTDEERQVLLRSVANHITPNKAQWYALCLRGHNSFDDVANHLKETAPALSNAVNFFYPTRTVMKRNGKKKEVVEIPYIQHIVFFRTVPEKVVPLMNSIGTLAWCYKAYNRPDAPYSVIPAKSMSDFQHFIGVFDDTSKIEFVKNTDLVQGKRVRITGGKFAGCEGEIIKEAKSTPLPDLRTFILRISNSVTLKWEATIEEQYLTPAP